MRRDLSRELIRTPSEKHLTDAFHCLFKRSKDAVFFLSKKGKVIGINPSATKRSKTPLREILGKDFRSIVPQETRKQAIKMFSEVSNGRSCRLELSLCKTQDKQAVLEVTAMPCRLKGKTVAMLGIIKDITENKQIERRLLESEHRYRNLIQTLPEAVYTISNDGKITSLNSAFGKITGWSRKKWLGKTFKLLVHPEDLPLAMETFQKAKKGRNQPPYELRIRTRSGKYLIGEFISKAYFENGRIAGEFGIVRNVTRRKAVETALRSSEEKYRALVQGLPDGVYQSSPEGEILTANKALVHMLGYSTFKELEAANIGRDLYVDPQQRTAWIKKLGKRHGTIRNGELLLRRKNGQTLIALENSRAVRDKKGVVISYEGTLTDITERKILEERLSALNRYARKINTAQNTRQIYKITLDVIEKTLGFENAAFMIVEKGRLRVAGQRGSIQSLLELPLDGSKRGITVKSANARKPVLVTNTQKEKDYVRGIASVRSELAVPIITGAEVLGVLDVESNKVGAFDQKDKMLLQILASHLTTAIDSLRKRKEIEDRSNQLALLMMISAEMIHSSDLHERLQKIAEAMREYGWRRVVIRAVRDQNLEITDPKDMVTAGITDEERQFLWTNRMPGQVWRERFGPEYKRFKVGEFYHLPWSDPWVRKRFSQGIVQSKLSQREMIDWNPDDLLYAPLRLTDGRIMGILSVDDPVDGKRPTKESLAPLELFIHQAAVAIENAYLIRQLNVATDQIREYAGELEFKVEQRTKALEEAQSKLVKTERLAAIGEVAAMVGHDLRNPLTGIAGAVYYLKTKSKSRINAKEKEMFELIEKDIEYSDKIITDLLDYSREIHLELRETALNDILEEALASVKVPTSIKVVNKIGERVKITADVKKIQRVFINMIRNSIDAMPNGGTLTINSTTDNQNWTVCFIDTGIGLQKEVLSKLWTPFFTTKAKGMGLGLPICKRIVEAHKGAIFVESIFGTGTKFSITIPTKLESEKKCENVWINLPESLSSMMTKP
jgi:PAS domain S-box-containing protein